MQYSDMTAFIKLHSRTQLFYGAWSKLYSGGGGGQGLKDGQRMLGECHVKFCFETDCRKTSILFCVTNVQ
jgi:hypothetical protein